MSWCRVEWAGLQVILDRFCIHELHGSKQFQCWRQWLVKRVSHFRQCRPAVTPVVVAGMSWHVMSSLQKRGPVSMRTLSCHVYVSDHHVLHDSNELSRRMPTTCLLDGCDVVVEMAWHDRRAFVVWYWCWCEAPGCLQARTMFCSQCGIPGCAGK